MFYIETKRRSIIKAISWRLFATMTTVIIIYIFFGRLDLALFAGVLESISKIVIYFVHERLWNKVNFGKKKLEPFNLWFTGLPLSGKTTVADIVYEKLKKYNFPLERIDSKDIRGIIPGVGFSKAERIRHLRRVQHLIRTLQSNSISTVASFVSPYETARNGLRIWTDNYIEVYMKTDVEHCKQRDAEGLYDLASLGEIKNFTGVSDVYEEPKNPDIVIEIDELNPEQAASKVLAYLKKNNLKGLNGV